MPKYRVNYVALKRVETHRRNNQKGVDELLDVQHPFREEGMKMVEAADEQEAMMAVAAQFAGLEFTAHVSRRDGRL